jgi:dienelactone hydrolase
MTAQLIYETLRDFHLADDLADRAARDGFLAWLITLPARNDPHTEARRALNTLSTQRDPNRACSLFVDFLTQAASRPFGRPERKGGSKMRRRILH